ncbi:hypothetical protein Nepgr_004948 [Nepenthes gracilis]|uniref:RING-type domain-containing protein n=1 Tax=Nepenthes gracilis TaxID=150966 RepID=A0AAD3S2C9_NEPGR|nr:hypothetical protein Nepgr_004948 [Nepenthes gracilis]
MTGATVLLSGRRTRASRSSDELGFDSSIDRYPTVDNNCCNSSTGRGSHKCRHQKANQNRQSRHRPSIEGSYDFGRSSHVSPLCARAALSGGSVSVRLDQGVSEAPSGSIINPETLNSMNRRYSGNDRLPRAVLLARERLLQRLRGISVSGVSQGSEASSGVHLDNFWLADAGDWETSIPIGHLPENRVSTESPSGARQPSDWQKLKKPPGLTKETLACLHHEVFTGVERSDGHPILKASADCCICLERFEGGNRLVSLPCEHRFHSSCLYPWVQTCGECPYCRTAIIPTTQG